MKNSCVIRKERQLNPWKGNKNAFEANQNLNANGRIAPLRDTFYLTLSGEVIRLVLTLQH